ncbi:MAG: hypothetical protein HY286_09845 [Planctomycetes bacterium]|nr:hypothetical protein [Planctomycetota bacterium]
MPTSPRPIVIANDLIGAIVPFNGLDYRITGIVGSTQLPVGTTLPMLVIQAPDGSSTTFTHTADSFGAPDGRIGTIIRNAWVVWTDDTIRGTTIVRFNESTETFASTLTLDCDIQIEIDPDGRVHVACFTINCPTGQSCKPHQILLGVWVCTCLP